MATTIRRMLLALALLGSLVALGGACAVHHHDDGPFEIVVSVHNQHGDMIWVEAVDGLGFGYDLGHVHPGEVVDFWITDSWAGHELIAYCEHDGSVVDTTWAWDGEHWDVE